MHIFFPQHIVEGLLNFCRRECVVSLVGIGLRRTPRGNGTGVIIVIPLRFLFSLCNLVLPFFPPQITGMQSFRRRPNFALYPTQITGVQFPSGDGARMLSNDLFYSLNILLRVSLTSVGASVSSLWVELAFAEPLGETGLGLLLLLLLLFPSVFFFPYVF